MTMILHKENPQQHIYITREVINIKIASSR